jgi:1-phosphatidylinositol-4-phosphate 5-kinase
MDSEFLRSKNLMDYSLLLVIEQTNIWKPDSRNRFTSSDNQVYHFGIIDFLQDWNLQKKIERQYKLAFKLKKGNSSDLSAVAPEVYQKRFSDFLSKHVLREKFIK